MDDRIYMAHVTTSVNRVVSNGNEQSMLRDVEVVIRDGIALADFNVVLDVKVVSKNVVHVHAQD